MRGTTERLSLKTVKEYFFCYKERKFQMMRSNYCYELADDNLMDHIREYIQARRDSLHGVVFEDIAEVFQAINAAKENFMASEFPDFIYDNGFIEHFEITSSKENRKGSSKKINDFLIDKEITPEIKEFNKSCGDMEIGERRSDSWSNKDVPHSYDNLEKSLKQNLEHHLGQAQKYNGKKDLKIYLVEYGDFGVEMCENIDTNLEYFAKNQRKPEHYWNYRLSKDKKMLKYLYNFQNQIDYIIMNYRDYCEILKIKEIPSIIESLPYDYTIVGRNNIVIRKQTNIKIGFDDQY